MVRSGPRRRLGTPVRAGQVAGQLAQTIGVILGHGYGPSDLTLPLLLWPVPRDCVVNANIHSCSHSPSGDRPLSDRPLRGAFIA